jgi:diacylglycerol kinase
MQTPTQPKTSSNGKEYTPANDKAFSADRLEDKPFSMTNRLQSVTWSFKGFVYFVTNTHAFWIQLGVVSTFWIAAAVLGCTNVEWAILILAGFGIFIAECLNTAIEIVVDRISPEYNKLSGLAKDVAAGAVMLAALMAFTVALVILVPKVLAL